MSAQILNFTARLDERKRPCRCPRHELEALADRVREQLVQHDGELLIPLDLLAAVLGDLTSTTDRLLPPTERTGP